MKEEKQAIFREKALRLYLRNQQKIVYLTLARPRLFPYFWGLLAGLALAAGLTWSARVPVTITGVGLTRSDAVIVLLPPDSLEQLRPKQRVLVRDRGARLVLVARIDRVEPDVLSPDAIRARFALSGALAGLIQRPAAVAVARVEAETGGLPAAAYAGGSSPIDVEIGSRRVLSLVPGLSR